MIQGVYDRRLRKISFPRTAITESERRNELRTNETFRNRLQPQHHHGQSILENLSIDMIKQFPVADALHLFDSGITKRYTHAHLHHEQHTLTILSL